MGQHLARIIIFEYGLQIAPNGPRIHDVCWSFAEANAAKPGGRKPEHVFDVVCCKLALLMSFCLSAAGFVFNFKVSYL
jgi:hypothetical protein